MELLYFCLCVIHIPIMVSSITISSNGNSPDIKMIGGMMVDVQQGFVPMTSTSQPPTTTSKSNTNAKIPKLLNSTKLSINERYRRLIPYMTFYYANDLTAPTTERTYNTKNVEVEKVEIVEAAPVNQLMQRLPKKIIYSYRNVPKYQGNRLTQYNIASANPTKLYKEVLPIQPPTKATFNFSPLDHNLLPNQNHGIFVPKPIYKPTNAPFIQVRKPYQNLYNTEEFGNVRYYVTEKETPKYKLVPYEQTPPVKVEAFEPQIESFIPQKNPIAIPVIIAKEKVHIKQRPTRPTIFKENPQYQQPRKQPSIVSESYYEKRRPTEFTPVVEGGFKPLTSPPHPSFSAPLATEPVHYENEQPVKIETSPKIVSFRPDYDRYVVDEPKFIPQPPSPNPFSANPSLGDLLNSLQINKSIPKPITRENVSASIRTLLQVLNSLKADAQVNDVDIPVINKPKPFVPSVVQATPKSVVAVTPAVIDDEGDFHQEQYLAPVNPPSQHLDDYPSDGGSTQRFPLQINSDDEGGTPGRPGVDYPTLTTIPSTSFDCKTQRYKGFFADPETRCQVWHYCDLNGGQASFLCPNGTIFSQAGLTCDWWFNVRCASTTQLYVLNESLYKFILPHSPKFPEDYSGPLVDKYLTLKFKEMEEQFRKKKKGSSDKEESEEVGSSEDSSEKEPESSPVTEESRENSDVAIVSEASVVLGSHGTSGNVERLHD